MDWLEGMVLGDMYQAAYKEIELERHPAKDRDGAKACVQCGSCCWKRPCGLAPSDVSEIAAFLEMSVVDLFDTRLVVDRINGDFYVVPIRVKQTAEAGDFLPDENTYDIDSPCIFLEDTGKDGRCSIHEVKPLGARQYGCWQPSGGADGSALRWSRADLKKYFNYTL